MNLILYNTFGKNHVRIHMSQWVLWCLCKDSLSFKGELDFGRIIISFWFYTTGKCVWKLVKEYFL